MDTHKIFLRVAAMIIGAMLLASPVAVLAQPAPPVYGCNDMHSSPLTGEPMSIHFAVQASAYNGAKIERVKFDFGDGHEYSTKNLEIRHTFANPGTYTVAANVMVSVNGRMFDAGTCQTSVTVGDNSGGTISEEEFSITYNGTVCYGSILSLYGSTYTIEEAGLVETGPNSLTLSHSYTEWGTCVIDGKPTTLTRFLGGSHMVYVTKCDNMSTLGRMHVSLGFTGDGIKEANTGYLIHPIADRPCEEGLPILVTESGLGWYRTCLERSILVAPNKNSPALFRCDPPA